MLVLLWTCAVEVMCFQAAFCYQAKKLTSTYCTVRTCEMIKNHRLYVDMDIVYVLIMFLGDSLFLLVSV